MKCVALLAPMPSELRPLVRALGLRRSASGDEALYEGTGGGLELVATTTGIGPPAAARAAERMLDSTALDHVVVVGIAGGIGPSVAIGALVVPELVRDLDTGAEHRPSHLGDVAPRGVLVTRKGLLTDRAAFERLEQEGAIAIDMETAAIAAVCARRGCPWSVFRAISDRADDGSIDASVFGLAGPDGSPNLRAVARFALTQPWRLPQLARLARDSRRAARVAATAAARALRA